LDYLIKKPAASTHLWAGPSTAAAASRWASWVIRNWLWMAGTFCCCICGCYPQVYCYYACSRHAIRIRIGNPGGWTRMRTAAHWSTNDSVKLEPDKTLG